LGVNIPLMKKIVIFLPPFVPLDQMPLAQMDQRAGLAQGGGVLGQQGTLPFLAIWN
jgi:hypothetical protein